MKQSLFLAAYAMLLAGAPLTAQQIESNAERIYVPTTREALRAAASFTDPLPNPNLPIQAAVQGAPLTLRGGAKATGLQGYYDYQSNGMSPHWLAVDPKDPQKLHAVYMLATDNFDSASVSSSRRVGYAYSADGGATWQKNADIGKMRLGFPYLELTKEGDPIIATHGDLTTGVTDGTGVRTLLYAAEAGKTDFNRIAKFPRRSSSNRDGDGGAGVIWPAFELNPKDDGATAVCFASLSPRTGESRAPLQFTVLNIGADAEGWVDFADSSISSTSGGEYVTATSVGGKIGVVYSTILPLDDGTSGFFLIISESTDGGNSWSDPQAIAGRTYLEQFMINGDKDTLTIDTMIDMAYVGEEPHVVFTTNLNGLIRNEWVMHWSPTNGLSQVAYHQYDKGLGTVGIVPTVRQPGFLSFGYPTISVSDDNHVLVTFMAAGQNGEEGTAISSENGFTYYRLWAVGSANGGKDWGDPFIVQDWADVDGGNTDSASIEFPSAGEQLQKVDGKYLYRVMYQARREPGMYAFVNNNVDGNNTAAQRGPFSECFQYYQTMMLGEENFQKAPSSVNNQLSLTNRMAINSAFPNPANDRLTVNYTLTGGGEVSLKLYNSLGDVVLAPISAENGYNGQHSRTLDLSGLPAGPYRIVLSQNGQSVSTPLNVVR